MPKVEIIVLTIAKSVGPRKFKVNGNETSRTKNDTPLENSVENTVIKKSLFLSLVVSVFLSIKKVYSLLIKEKIVVDYVSINKIEDFKFRKNSKKNYKRPSTRLRFIKAFVSKTILFDETIFLKSIFSNSS